MRKKGDRTVAALVVLVSVLLILQTVTFLLATAAPQQQATGQVAQASGTISFVFVRALVGACQANLTNGWTLVSLCANATNSSIADLMGNIDYRYIMRWNQSEQNFDIFSPNQADPPFTRLDYNTSYFVNLNSASDQIDIEGDLLGDTNVSLVTGWNGPGFPYNFTANITKYFNASKYRYLMKWNASAQEFIIYSPRAAVPVFENISKGEGQLLSSQQADTLQYNKTFLES